MSNPYQIIKTILLFKHTGIMLPLLLQKEKKKKRKTNSGQMKTKSENLFRIQQRIIILSLSE